MIYYELLEDGTIGRSTNSIKVAQMNGYYNENQVVENENDIFYDVDGKRYLKKDNLEKFNQIIDKEEKTEKITKLTKQLESTDYIANKLAEANAEYIVTEDKTKLIELRTKYAKELADRETWRKEIDSLKEKLKNL